MLRTVLTNAVYVKMQLLTNSLIKSIFYLYIKNGIFFKFELMLNFTS